MPLLLILSLVSFKVLATDWMDLVNGKAYKINQDFQLTQKERSGSKLDISKGDTAQLTKSVGLPSIGIMLYIFDYKNCPGIAMTTEMEIIPVQETSPMIEIGAQLEENCELHIYIENKDLMSKSLFE